MLPGATILGWHSFGDSQSLPSTGTCWQTFVPALEKPSALSLATQHQGHMSP